MKIAYYMPFKPMGHKNPSGDLIIGTELYDFLGKNGGDIELVSRFRCRWIYLKPYLWPVLIAELFRVILVCKKRQPDIWVSYHSYYKAPDVIGSLCCRLLNIPYVIFQGIYSTKRRRSIRTLPGFLLNRMALTSADCVIANKRPDEKNLRRLLSKERVMYVPPGLHPEEFHCVERSRKTIRNQWQVENKVVILTAAMFRAGVKTDGIIRVIRSCRILRDKGRHVFLVIAGDGTNREMLEEMARRELGGDFIFLGKVARHEMKHFYSAADIFAFPGIQESLGMVFLEAQSCGLPVVAYEDWGASEAVVDKETGLLSPAAMENHFTDNLEKLVEDRNLRHELGGQAAKRVRSHHDIEKNYAIVWQRLRQVANDNPLGEVDLGSGL